MPLGFFLLPWTTLAYAVMWSSSDGVRGFEWFIVVLAFFLDLASWAGGAAREARPRASRSRPRVGFVHEPEQLTDLRAVALDRDPPRLEQLGRRDGLGDQLVERRPGGSGWPVRPRVTGVWVGTASSSVSVRLPRVREPNTMESSTRTRAAMDSNAMPSRICSSGTGPPSPRGAHHRRVDDAVAQLLAPMRKKLRQVASRTVAEPFEHLACSSRAPSCSGAATPHGSRLRRAAQVAASAASRASPHRIDAADRLHVAARALHRRVLP